MGIRHYTEAGLACGTTYYYVVKASANIDSATTPENRFTTPTCPPNDSSWQLVGTAGIPGSTYHWSVGNIGLAIDNNGTPLVGYVDTSNNWKASVVKLDGTQWVQVGMAGFSGGSEESISIDKNNTPSIIGYNSSNQPNVMKFDGANWVPVGTTFISYPGCPALAFDSQNTPYVACRNGGERVNVLKFNNVQWEQVGSANFSGGSAHYLTLAIDNHDTPYVAYRDNDSPTNQKASVMKFDGSNWVYVGTRGFSAGSLDYVSLVIDKNGAPYVAYLDSANDGKASVQKFDGTQWIYVGTAGLTPSQARFPRLVIDSNNVLYIAYSDGLYGGGKASVMKFDGTQWKYVGNAGFSDGSVNDVQLAIDRNDTLYVAYADSAQSNRTTVMKFVNAAPKVNQTLTFTLPSNATLGDAPLTLSATATSGLTVTFASATPAVCMVSGTTLTLVGAGTCTVTANQAGNANYNAAPPISKNLTVLTKASQTLTFTSLPPTTYGQAPLTLNATASSGLTVRYTATGKCTVAGNTVTLTGAGTCNLTASQSGNAHYQAASSVTQTLTINKAPLSLTADDKTVNEGSALPTFTVTADGFVNSDTTTSLDNFTVTTQATATSLAGIYPLTVTASDADYKLTLRNGTLTIQAAGFNVTQTSDSTSLAEGGATDTLSVVLKFAPQADVSVVILPDSQLDLGNGGGIPLTQTFTPSTWNTPQTVTVRAVDDTVIEGTHAGWLAFRTASTDATFHNKVVADLKATILDNDVGVIVPTYPVAVSSQKIATYPVQLSTIPTSPVTLTLTTNDTTAILTPATLTFTADASALEPQWVTVTLSKNSYRYLVTVTHTITQSSDPNYPTTLAIEDVSLAQSSRSQYLTSQLGVSLRGSGRILSDIGGLSCQNNRGMCKATYLTETEVRLQPIPATGYQFSEWEGSPDCLDSHLLMKPGDNKRCTANFVAVATTAKVTLSVSVSSGVGQVTSNVGVMSCQTTRYGRNTCQGSYVPGTLVILTPVPATGYQFSRWTGDKDCTDGMVLMNVKKICNVVFVSTTGKRSSLEDATNRQTCEGTGHRGISVNGQTFSPCATVTLADTVTIRGEITVAPEDVGQTAELVVYATYWPLGETDETLPQYLMLDNLGQIWPWDEDPATLIAFQTGVVLAPVQTVDLYQGRFLGTGELSIFLGYRLEDGTVVVSPLGVEVIIR
jgi:hypothetical protein